MDDQHNVDAGEIAKFEALATRWWDPEGEFRPLHAINPLRLDYIDSHAPLQGSRVLDIGCGGGILSESMASRGARVTGIDMGQAPLQVARLHLLESTLKIEYLHTTAEQFAARHPASYDVVTCMEMLEHVPDPASVVAACARLVKPGGQVFLSTINRNPKAWLLAIVGAEYLLRLLPKGTHEYHRLIKPSELTRWCRQAALRPQQITGLHYNPLTREFRLGAGADVNYLLRCQAPDA